MDKNEELLIISERYKQRIRSLYDNAISDQEKRFPTIPVDFLKIDVPKNVPEKKVAKINKKVIKDLKKQNKLRTDATLLNIKSIKNYVNDEELMKDLLREMPPTNENIAEVYHGVKVKMPSMLDTYFERFKSGYIELFSLFENFNNDVYNLFNLKLKIQGRSVHNLRDVSKEYNKLGLNIESFLHWSELNEYHLIRNALVHRDGLIDEEFIKRSNIRTKKDVGKKIHVYPEFFYALYIILLSFINFVVLYIYRSNSKKDN